MVSEPVLNTMLSEYLAKGLAKAISVPESRVRIFRSRTRKTRQPDIYIVDLLGIRIIVEGKIENLQQAIRDCKNRIEEGLADICFAIAYPKNLTELREIMKVKEQLEGSVLEVALVKPPTQMTLEGWPEDSVKHLGRIKTSGLLEILESESVYDEIVGTESAERIAFQISDALQSTKRLPRQTLRAIHKRLTEVLRVVLDVRVSERGSEYEEE